MCFRCHQPNLDPQDRHPWTAFAVPTTSGQRHTALLHSGNILGGHAPKTAAVESEEVHGDFCWLQGKCCGWRSGAKFPGNASEEAPSEIAAGHEDLLNSGGRYYFAGYHADVCSRSYSRWEMVLPGVSWLMTVVDGSHFHCSCSNPSVMSNGYSISLTHPWTRLSHLCHPTVSYASLCLYPVKMKTT